MKRDEAREIARALAREAHARGDATGWFEQLYAGAKGDLTAIPWADSEPHPMLASWIAANPARRGERALVVGCGLGEDSHALTRAGYEVTAFDVSRSAIEWCKRRYTGSNPRFEVADLFAPPSAWTGAFDFVFECYTLQALPAELRPSATEHIASFLAPNGRLLVVTRAREPEEPIGKLPWPLTRSELDRFGAHGLALERLDDVVDDEDPPVRRFRAEYRASR